MLTIATKIDNASINKSVNQLSTKVRDGLESAFVGIDKKTQEGFEKTIESIGEGRLKNVNLSGQFKELTSSILSSKNADELKESFKKFSSIIGMIDDLAAGRGKIGGMMPTLRSLDNSQMSRLVESLSAEKHAKDLRDKKTLNGKKAEDLYSEAEAKSIDNLLKKYPKAEKEAEKFKKQILDSDENGVYKKASSSIEGYSKLVGLLKEMEKHSPKKDDKNIISYGKEMENVFSSMSKYEADSKKYGSEKSIGDFLKTVRKDSGVLKGQDAYFQYRGVASAEDYINAINSRNLKKKTQEKENLIRKLQEEINKRGERVSASYENWKEESGETGKAGDANPPDANNFKTAIITVEQYDEALKN